MLSTSSVILLRTAVRPLVGARGATVAARRSSSSSSSSSTWRSSFAMHSMAPTAKKVITTSAGLCISIVTSDMMSSNQPECRWAFWKKTKETDDTPDDEIEEAIVVQEEVIETEAPPPPAVATPSSTNGDNGKSTLVEQFTVKGGEKLGQWKTKANETYKKVDTKALKEQAIEQAETTKEKLEAWKEQCMDIIKDRDNERQRLVYSYVTKPIDKAIEDGLPAQVTVGFAAGCCSGYALKKMSRVVVVGLGVVFCTAQVMSYYGLIELNFKELKKAMGILDTNKDGTVDYKDAMDLKDAVMMVLTHNIPASSGYGAGIVLGFRKG